MTCNVGGIDRIGRTIIGIVLLAVGFWAPLSLVWDTVVFVVAGILLITAVVQYCPLNALFGINSCRESASNQPKQT